MNWVLITVGGIFLISILVGLWRGAIKIVVSLVTTILTLVLVYFATPYVADAVVSFTPLETLIETQINKTAMNAATMLVTGENGVVSISEDAVRNALSAAGVSEEDLNAMGITIQDIVDGKVTSDDLAEYGISRNVLSGASASVQSVEDVDLGAIPRDVQITTINNSDIPDVFKSLLLTNNNEEIYQKLGADGFISYVSKYMARLIINIVSFLLTLIVIAIVVRAIVFALDIVSNLPVLGFVNRLAGGVLGAGGALIVVWLLFLIITMMYTTTIGKELYMMIQEEPILSIIYEYNPILKLATTFK